MPGAFRVWGFRMDADQVAEILRDLADDIEDGDEPPFIVTIVEDGQASTYTNIPAEEEAHTIH